MKMRGSILCFVLVTLAALTLSAPAQLSNQRQKRVSDQRLAELETLIALAQMKNRKYMSLPVGFGLIDVQQIGRRKRSTLAPLTQFVYPHEISEYSLKNSALPFKMGDLSLKAGGAHSIRLPHYCRPPPRVGEKWRTQYCSPARP